MVRTSPTTTGTDRPASASRRASGGRPAGLAPRGDSGGRPAGPAPLSDIADPGLALAGQPGIAWAERAMPVLGMVRTSFAGRLPVAGLTVACWLNVTAETAGLGARLPA